MDICDITRSRPCEHQRVCQREWCNAEQQTAQAQHPQRVPTVPAKPLAGWWHGAFVSHLDLSRAPYGFYGVKYIDMYIPYFLTTFLFLYEAVPLHMCVLPYKYPYTQGCDLSCTYYDPTVNDRSHYCRFMIGHCLGRMVKYWKCCCS